MNLEDVCICGHSASDHHISWFPGGGQMIEECEAYGSNESGGLDDNNRSHCFIFRKQESHEN